MINICAKSKFISFFAIKMLHFIVDSKITYIFALDLWSNKKAE